MKKAFLPDRNAEEKRYKAHQNDPQDAGYIRFLNQAVIPALPYLNNKMQGLDYGCGPTQALAGLLKLHGLHCENYDPFFYPDMHENCFDFIFSTEVIEHFFNPAQELARISKMLIPGGILTIMTEPWVSAEHFSEWHYAKDTTHVCFYHANTIAFICSQYGFELLNHDSPRVWVLKKSLQPDTSHA